MTEFQAKVLIAVLTDKGVKFESGLNSSEIEQAEALFEFRFPPDLRTFLQCALPISDRFVDWRSALSSDKTKAEIQNLLAWPLEGILFDIEHNIFWHECWGKKPISLTAQKLIAEEFVSSYPKLIPIYSHRYIPASPAVENNPVFSVYQMDIIYYGYDLAGYFAHEFKFSLPEGFVILEKPVRIIEFWGENAGE